MLTAILSAGIKQVQRQKRYGVSLVVVALLPIGCSGPRQHGVAHFQTGESLVLVGQIPARLAFTPSTTEAVHVRSTYRDDLSNTVNYVAGQDFVVAANGEIQRATNSRIPDFATNMLFGKEDFNHGQFPGYGNNAFFIYVDYPHCETWKAPVAKAEFSAKALPRAQRKLLSGASLRIVAYGDSITTGGEASEPKLIFWERWADALRAKYPTANIETINGATGGDSTVQGLVRLHAKVLSQKPDLVLVGFGMNDHNREGYGVPLEKFSENLQAMIDRIRSETDAEIVLFSAFPPNPKWHFGSHNMVAYADATEQVAREKHCAFADVFHPWQQIAELKKPEDMLANNINHPNDFGHWIYFQAFMALGL
jgi:acyl-CoA thioesterase I